MLAAYPRRVKSMLAHLLLQGTSRRVRRDGLTYLSPHKLWRLERTIERIVRSGVPGDILEFGVALGGSAIVLSNYAKEGRAFHGFDVFSMIPPPRSEKDDAKSLRRYETIRSGKSKGIKGEDDYYGYRDNLFEDVKDSFSRYGHPVGSNNIYLHKGLFEDTLPSVPIKSVCFAHVDCDWYDPVKYCLDQLAGRIGIGGAILVDDYHDYGGARSAVDEFLLGNREFGFEPGPNPILWKR